MFLCVISEMDWENRLSNVRVSDLLLSVCLKAKKMSWVSWCRVWDTMILTGINVEGENMWRTYCLKLKPLTCKERQNRGLSEGSYLLKQLLKISRSSLLSASASTLDSFLSGIFKSKASLNYRSVCNEGWLLDRKSYQLLKDPSALKLSKWIVP